MDEEIRKLLGEEIIEEIQALHSLEPGSKEKSTAIDDLSKLYKLRLDETKNDCDFDDKYDARAYDKQFKKEQLAEQVKDRYFRFGLEAGGMILTLILYDVWMKRGFRFEETGTYTSKTFMGLINRFKPTRK